MGGTKRNKGKKCAKRSTVVSNYGKRKERGLSERCNSDDPATNNGKKQKRQNQKTLTQMDLQDTQPNQKGTSNEMIISNVEQTKKTNSRNKENEEEVKRSRTDPDDDEQSMESDYSTGINRFFEKPTERSPSSLTNYSCDSQELYYKEDSNEETSNKDTSCMSHKDLARSTNKDANMRSQQGTSAGLNSTSVRESRFGYCITNRYFALLTYFLSFLYNLATIQVLAQQQTNTTTYSISYINKLIAALKQTHQEAEAYKKQLKNAREYIIQIEEKEKQARTEAAAKIVPKKIESLGMKARIRENVRTYVFTEGKHYLVNDKDWKDNPGWVERAMKAAGIPETNYKIYHRDAITICRASINDRRNDVAKKFKAYLTGKKQGELLFENMSFYCIP